MDKSKVTEEKVPLAEIMRKIFSFVSSLNSTLIMYNS